MKNILLCNPSVGPKSRTLFSGNSVAMARFIQTSIGNASSR